MTRLLLAFALLCVACDVGRTSERVDGTGGRVSTAEDDVGGSGGSAPIGPTVPVPDSTGSGEFGFVPAPITADVATLAYEDFALRYFEDCGGGEIRVIKNGSETVSEGIAYGMLLTVAHDDRASFDGLWAYYRARRNERGVMNWRINGCTTEAWGQNGATDAELDAAMALIQAECRWGGYAADASELLSAIRLHEVQDAGGLLVLKPGDVWGGENCTNPSYFSPGYYRAFAAFEPEYAALWVALAEDSYTVLEVAADPDTGLIPDWTDVAGTAGGSDDGCPNSPDYAYDAARIPWRLATDYVWWGTPEAKALLDRQTEWVVASGGIGTIGDRYRIDGSMISDNHNSTFVGAFALGAMAHSQERADEFGAEFLAISDNAYFEEALRAVYMLLATGTFVSGC